MKKFEHYAVSVKPLHYGPMFPKLGEEGWELVSVICLIAPGGEQRAIYYFKREKNETSSTEDFPAISF